MSIEIYFHFFLSFIYFFHFLVNTPMGHCETSQVLLAGVPGDFPRCSHDLATSAD